MRNTLTQRHLAQADSAHPIDRVLTRATVTPDTKAILALARAEAHRAKATVSSLLLAAHTLETLGDEFDRAIAKGIREFLAEDHPHGLPTRAQQLATSMAADGNAARIAQHFEDMNTRRHPGLIRRFLGAIGISCCVFGAVHMGTDLGARVAADVQRGALEYCGQC